MKAKILLYAATAALAVSACSLKEKVDSYSTRETYYKSEAQIITGLNGCYSPLRGIIGNQFFQMTECAADLMMYNVSTDYNSNCNISPDRPGIGSTVWKNGYNGVMLCNEMADVIKSAVDEGHITAKQSEKLLAETYILRAMYYYLLTCTFGDVPFYTYPVTEENRATVAKLPRMSADNTRDYLIDQLMEYLLPAEMGKKEALQLVRSYEGDSNYRMGAADGLMLAGKMCLWNKRWEDAVTVFTVLEQIYGDFRANPSGFGEAYPLTDIPFSRKWTAESILEMGNIVEAYGVQFSGKIASMCMPLRTTGNTEDPEAAVPVSDIYNGIAIPELGSFARTSVSARPTAYYYQRLMPYGGKDLRSGEYSAGANIARGGSGNLAWRWMGYSPSDNTREKASVLWFTTVSSNGNNRPWLGNKFWCYGMYNYKDSNNYKLFRFAGALLGKAEALLMLGDMDGACDYLNITRTRAGLDKLTPSAVGNNASALMEEIRMECARELFGEFQRKFDLVRWGIWYERTQLYNDGTYIQEFIRPCHRYWPIPSDQVTYSGYALDNKEYLQ